MKKYVSCIIASILFIIYFFIYQTLLSHVLIYHEQHHLFLFSKSYFFQQFHSYGIFYYITDFVIQFFYYPFLGSIIIAGILALIYLFISKTIKKVTGHSDLFQISLIPSLVLFLYTISLSHTLEPVIVSCIITLLLFIVTRFIPHSFSLFRINSLKDLRTKKYYLLTFILLLVYGGITSWMFIRNYNMNERRMILVEKNIKDKNWEGALSITKKYLASGRNNQLISYFHNIALYHIGEMPYQLFDYPQTLGVKALYFPWNSNSRESEFGHYIHEDMGHINEAQRWEFEAMVVWGETAPHLYNLARYNIVNHRPKVAQRFINLLKQSLFYNKDAQILEKDLSSGKVDGLYSSSVAIKDSTVRFSNVLNAGPEFLYLCQNDSTNQMAFEYLMSDLLLSNNVTRFVDNLKFIKNFSYPSIPPIYEEALYLYKLGVDKATFKQCGFDVSPEIEDKFKQYYTLYKAKDMNQLKKEFSNTYWYYLHFVSPYGNKIKNN